MKRLGDLSILCVALVLVVAALRGPSFWRAGTEPQRAQATGSTNQGGEDGALLRDFLRVASASDDSADDGRSGPLDRSGRAGAPGGHESWGRRLERPTRVIITKLTPDMIDLCVEIAQEIDPHLAEQLRVLRLQDQEKFERKLRQSRRLVALAELKQRDASLYELKLLEIKVDADVLRLAREVKQARREGRDYDAGLLAKELRAQVILQQGFSIRNREDYLCRLQELVQRLDRELEAERQPENFERIVDQRLKQLLSDHDPTNRGPEVNPTEPPRDGELGDQES